MEGETMYKIHPIVVGTKVFDKSMMTYQYGNGQEYTIPIYCWYIEAQQSKVLCRHAAKSIGSTARFLLFDIIIR